MNREALQAVPLSDGTCIPKGAMLDIPTYPMHTPNDHLYHNADKYDGRRFLALRADDDSKWQFVMTSPEHYGFGHGKQFCPGRFFASNEIKILAAHMLLMFDWQFAEGDEPKRMSMIDGEFAPDPAQKIWVKSRVPEVDLQGH